MNELSVQQLESGSELKGLLGELLIDKGLVEPDEMNKALDLQQQIGGRIGSILLRMGAVSEDSLLECLSQQLGYPLLSSDQLPTDYQRVVDLFVGHDINWCLDQETIAWEMGDGEIFCISRDPLDGSINEIIEQLFPARKLQWCLVRNHDLERAIEGLSRVISTTDQDDLSSSQLRELAEEAPVIEFVNNLLAQAFEQRASDIHIEPEKQSVRIRFRIDGVLYSRFTLPFDRFSAIASRIKLASGMDIAEHRLPQDGQLEARVSGGDLDIRVSALPGVHGESIVLRLLPKEKQKFDLDSLGLGVDNLERLKHWAEEPHGIILVTGPTGSGKSTTLYSLLDSINDGSRKIITVEDPVEYRLQGITQIQAMEEIDFTFARALRSILRQDPDVIMIGEIRDGETAGIAIQSSLTGHLVLSTLHTNDAVSAFTRLIDMGVEPFLVATPIRAVMAQRLLRRLCRHCSVPATPAEDIVSMMKGILSTEMIQNEANWAEPAGCEKCQGTGFSGRIAIHELVPVTREIQHLIVQGGSTAELQQLACQQGALTLREDGFAKAYQGITSVEEVLRVTAGGGQ
ncbi:MAG: ATPase, T2SS/T4P/T4SS family [Pseudomonadota bacterium]|nr:ATPase, T2SS/T4P/T4SS family [Pseudomonadota bacterium]